MVANKLRKPTLFISHATYDAEFANAVKQEIETVFAKGIHVYSTSSPGSVAAGKDWLEDMETRLEAAQAVVVIITPVSIKRPWLWFELGATWLKSRRGKSAIYPLCAPGMNALDIPEPLNRLQLLAVDRRGDLRRFFKALITQFGFGNLSSFRPSRINESIPSYEELKIAAADLDSDSTSLRYAWKFISEHHSLNLTNDRTIDPRFDVFARFVLAILSEDRPEEGFSREYVYMRVFNTLQHLSEKPITYGGKTFLRDMGVLEFLSLVEYDYGVWSVKLLGHELIERWPADWIYYSDKEVAEILRISKTEDYLTLEEADEIISECFE